MIFQSLLTFWSLDLREIPEWNLIILITSASPLLRRGSHWLYYPYASLLSHNDGIETHRAVADYHE